jgi:hypothetical protein
VERKSGPDGTFVQVGSARDTNTFLDVLVPSGTCFYRVKSWNFNGESAYSEEFSPPVASITSPVAQSFFAAGTNVTVGATAAAAAGCSIATVEFFTNNILFAAAATSPYTATLNNIAVGEYRIAAKATDSLGNSSFSAFSDVFVPIDSDSDGFNDFEEILMGTDPTDSTSPGSPPNDHTPPTITLEEPTDAVLLPQ